MNDKPLPLHVRVAEALGWEYVPQVPDRLEGGFWIAPNRDRVMGQAPPHYDTDWSVTGPLIEKYGLTIGRFAKWFMGGQCYAVLPGESTDSADLEGGSIKMEAHGPTQLVAVCNLILLLGEAGKL